jgi:hypothetical protein
MIMPPLLSWLRWPLILASLAGALVCARDWLDVVIYTGWSTSEMISMGWTWADRVGLSLILEFVVLLLNAVYLYFVKPGDKPGRFFGFIGLWLELKEAEMRARIDELRARLR